MSKFIDSIKSKLKNDELSDKSINLYINNLKKLNNNKAFSNFNFLRDDEKLKEYLKKYSDNTKKNYYASIVRILKLFKSNKKLESLYNKFTEDLNLLMKTTNENKNEKNEKESKNWLDFSEVIKRRDELEEKYNEIIKKKKITEKQYDDLLRYVILSLYTYISPRRNLDYMEMVVEKENKDLDKQYNYFIIKDKLFIFYKYKTAKSYNDQEIKVPDELFNILTNFLKYNKTKDDKRFLLVDYNGNRLNQINSITRLLNSIFKKKIGSSMLRKIFISHKFGSDLEKLKEMEQTAKEMGHSIGSQQNIYNKGE